MYRFLFIISLLLLLPLSSAQAVTTHANWNKAKLILPDPLITNVEVIKTGSSQWRMYYSYAGSVLSKVSKNGVDWASEDGVRLENSGMVSVFVLPDDTIRLYFSRNIDGTNVMLSAVSSDGLTFTEEDGIRLSPGHAGGFDTLSGITHPGVVQLKNGNYRAYYDTLYTGPATADDCDEDEDDCDDDDNSSQWKILSATSTDGLNFTIDAGIRIRPKQDLPTPADAVWNCHVRRRGNNYEMYVAAQYDSKPLTRNAIYKATSTNGRQWTVQKRSIILRSKGLTKKETGYGMNGAPQDPFVITINGHDRIYFWVANKGIYTARTKKKI